MGDVGGGSGGWHVEFLVAAAVANRHQRLFGTGVLSLTLQRLTAHDELTFGCYPCCDGDCLRSCQA